MELVANETYWYTQIDQIQLLASVLRCQSEEEVHGIKVMHGYEHCTAARLPPLVVQARVEGKKLPRKPK